MDQDNTASFGSQDLQKHPEIQKHLEIQKPEIQKPEILKPEIQRIKQVVTPQIFEKNKADWKDTVKTLIVIPEVQFVVFAVILFGTLFVKLKKKQQVQ